MHPIYQRMMRLFCVYACIIFLAIGCGSSRKNASNNQNVPLSITPNKESGATDKPNVQLGEPIALDSSKPLDSKPLVPSLVVFRIVPAEMSNHVPVRTTVQAFGDESDTRYAWVTAYPAPGDLTPNMVPLALEGGFFLDRSGFVGPGTRFLDLHFEDYLDIPNDSLTSLWFNAHLIPSDAMQFEWLVCACNKGDEAANVHLINTMIRKGIDAFRDPANRTQIHPRFGSDFPKK
jgi:hypothetical protein